jgi:hypothetical protein
MVAPPSAPIPQEGSNCRGASRSLCLLVLILLSGCARASPVPGSADGGTTRPSEVIFETQVPAVIPTPTQEEDSGTPVIPSTATVRPIQAEIVAVCPVDPEVPFSQLQVDHSLRLLVAETGVGREVWPLYVSQLNSMPTRAPNTEAPPGWASHDFYPSPSARWIVVHYVRPSDGSTLVRLVSTTGDESHDAATLQEGEFPRWVADDRLVILGYTRGDLEPLSMVDPFTGERTELQSLPQGETLEFVFSHEEHLYAVYALAVPDRPFFVYDYSRGSATPAFPWLASIEGEYIRLPGVGQRPSGLFFSEVPRPYGFDIALDLDFEDITEDAAYDEVMTPVMMPWAHERESGAYIWATGGAFPMTRVTPGNYVDPAPLYMFDYHRGILTDYCLAEILADLGVVHSGMLYGSPDGQLLALTLLEVGDSQAPIFSVFGSLVLDVVSGRFTVIEGYEPRGWVLGLP